MPKFFLTKSQWLSATLAFVASLLFLHLAQVCYFADSEIWLLTLSQQIFNSELYFSIYYKLVFHLFTFFGTHWSSDLMAYPLARWMFAGLALLSLGLLSGTVDRIFPVKHLFFPVFLIGLTSSVFFNQGFRIRADIVALFFHSLLFWLVFGGQNKRWQTLSVFLVVQVFLLFTTPKAVIFILVHLLWGFLMFTRGSTPQHRQLGRTLLLSVLVPSTLVLWVLVCLSVFNSSNSLFKAVHSGLDFYLKSFDPALGGASFFARLDLMYVYHFVVRSPLHALLLVWGALRTSALIVLKPQITETQRVLQLSSSTLLILVLLYNQKLPFFLGAFLAPVLAIEAGIFLSHCRQRRWGFLTESGLVIGMFLLMLVQYQLNTRFNSNKQQLAVVAELQKYKASYPHVKIYDVIGLLPLKTTHFLFVGPGEVSQRSRLLQQIRAQAPDVYLYTLKNILLEPDLTDFLKQNYIEDTPGVWLRAESVKLDAPSSWTKNIVKVGLKTYWELQVPSQVRVFDQRHKKEIRQNLELQPKTSPAPQKETKIITIDLNTRELWVVATPPLRLSQNPYDVFRFDTSF